MDKPLAGDIEFHTLFLVSAAFSLSFWLFLL